MTWIQLTNAIEQHENEAIAINTDNIVTVREGTRINSDDSISRVTYIHCPPHGTCEVHESYVDVMQLLSLVSIE